MQPPHHNACASHTTLLGSPTVHSVVHRFEETIGDRAYRFEVVAVAALRWRAYIAKAPGVPSALMPFYGATPEEAIALLTGWLQRVGRPGTDPTVRS